ncbi:MAG: T9SS type A sorting domain-containing protein [Bacteroidota bacterium]|nr:T9SS type A sorting domain-containing protein [Bacteroidota bacterium]
MKRIQISIYIFISLIFFTNKNFSQGEIVDDFSKKTLPDWIWGGVEMKYSHEEDNKENGFAEIYSNGQISGKGYIGKIMLKREHLFTGGNYIDVMLKGVDNDATIKIQLLYDIDKNNLFNEKKDLVLTSNPVSMNFSGWKEIKIKLDQENFQLKSNTNDNFEVTEENVFGIQMEFEAGKDYKTSKFESGIALISEIINKEIFTENEYENSASKESYFGIKNYPNPFNPTTTISYILPQATYVSVTIYDRLGRQVVVLIEENQDPGEHSIDFDASEYPSGIYFYRIKTPEKTEVRKMLLTK